MLIGAVIRFIVSAIVLLLVGFLIPGFRIMGFFNALLAALAIAAIGWVIEALLGRNVSPQARGLVGFLTAAVVIYAVQFIVPGMSVSIIGALLASLIIGIVDAFVPTALR
ncbi:MAG TPA: phage holin family protein [Thermaerobacter sp.]